MPQPEQKIKPNTTMVSNLFLDNLDLYSGNVIKVFLFLSRKTSGWHKETQWCSLSYIKKGTGISNNNGVLESLETLLKDGWIQRKKVKVRGGTSYEYILSDSVDIEAVRKSYQYENDTSTKMIPLAKESGTKIVHNKRNNNLIKETISTQSVAGPPMEYGDPDVNYLYQEGLKILEIPRYDGSIKENRKNARIAINKFREQGGADAVLAVLKASKQSSFWSGKITSFGDVLKHGMKVIGSFQSEKKGGRVAYV